jgi:hypothetical protein
METVTQEILEKTATIRRGQTANFLIFKEHNKCPILLIIAGIECLRIGKAKSIKLKKKWSRHIVLNATLRKDARDKGNP